MMLYSSFALLINDRRGFYCLLPAWLSVFVTRIHSKEKSLVKKEGYAKY